MAELQQVQVDSTVENENPSLEEQAAAMDAVEQQDNNRPEWLPEKFENAEALAKAYAELESKQSEEEVVEEQPQAEQAEPTPMGEAIAKATQFFDQHGELDEATFKDLEQAGIPRSYVEAYVKGNTLIADTESAQVMESVGGPENYQAMSQWAGETLSDQELESYNQIVNSGDVNQATMAVQGLYARFQSNAQQPSLMQGSTKGSSSGPTFQSAAEVMQAMKDPRYSKDPAYRRTVEDRLARSNVL